MDDAAVLHALVMTAPDDFVIAHEHRADGYAPGGQSFFGFIDGGL
jgi:hypothetical protein